MLLTYWVRQQQRYDRPDATPGPAKLLDGGLVTFASGRHLRWPAYLSGWSSRHQSSQLDLSASRKRFENV
ncbi:hypothetical protein ARTHRO9V_100203 [Arthrobacter sp. 9V]|nr:hypothetical protein ARTHRO9V_100203 [Arthrobacter sp. 9V]